MVFDLDGTLLDFETASHEALNAAAIEVTRTVLGSKRQRRLKGVADKEPVTWALHGSILGTRADHWAPMLLSALGLNDKVDYKIYARDVEARIAGAYEQMTLMPGAMEVIDAIRRDVPNVRLAIATSSSRRGFELKMAYHADLLAKFDAVVTGDEVERGKPAPDIFLEALRRIGVPASRAVAFEDAPAGCASAKSAGMYVVAVPDARMTTGGATSAERFAAADLVCSSLQDIVLDATMRRKLLRFG